MKPIKKTIYRRDTKTYSLILLRDGAPINLTGYTPFLSGKKKVDDSTYLFDRSGSATVAAEGLASVTLSSMDTKTVCESVIVDVVLVKDSDGTQDTLAQIFLTIKDDVKKTP